MRKLERYLGIVLLVLLTGMVCSCGKERLSDTSSERVNVTLRLNARGNTDVNTSPVATNEGIKTLRVIITNKTETAEIVESNIYRVYDTEDEQKNASKSLVIMGLNQGQKNFYVIANEQSVGFDENTFPGIGTDITQNNSLNPTNIIIDNNKFPCLSSEIADKGLPIAGMASIDLTDKKYYFIDIDLIHAVKKVVFKIQNTSSSSITLTGFKFGSFFANKTYLFSQSKTGLSDVVYTVFEKTDYSKEFLSGNSAEEYFTCYLYETSVNKVDEFKIQLYNNNNIDLPAARIDVGDEYIIARNTMVDITATINRDATKPVYSIGLQWQVTDWTDVNNDVPVFQ